jgi:DNA-binding transcriptional ArsR family regulator
MLVRVLRRLTIEEVERQMKELETTYGKTFAEFEEELLEANNPEEKMLEAYLKWANLVNAYHGYVEGGELHCVAEEQRDLSRDELKSLTPRRLELLYALSDLRADSINSLAHKVRRDVKNVYHDLQVLKKLGLVSLVRKKDGRVIPEPIVEEVTFATR